MNPPASASSDRPPIEKPRGADQSRADQRFLAALGLLPGFYALAVLAMLAAALGRMTPRVFVEALAAPEIQFSLKLSLLTATATTFLALLTAIPGGYLLARCRFPLKGLLEFLLDIPILLPPLVVGLALLLLFQAPPLRWVETWAPVTYHVPAIILAQSAVVTSLCVRMTRITFEGLDPELEEVALTLGCTRWRAFTRICVPEARHGWVSAGIVAWTRAFGEFGPVLVFAGATRFRTEVLPTSVYIELSVGRLERAVAVSALMIAVALLARGLAHAAGLTRMKSH